MSIFDQTIPQDSLTPRERFAWPDGRYSADLIEVNQRTNETGWEGIAPTFGNAKTLADDSDTVEVEGKTVSLADRTIRDLYTTVNAPGKNPEAVRIGVERTIALAGSLGLAQKNGDGDLFFAAEDTEDAVSQLNGAAGLKRVGVTIFTPAGKDTRITQVFDLDRVETN